MLALASPQPPTEEEVSRVHDPAGVFPRYLSCRYFDKQEACDAAVADCPKLKAISANVAANPGIAKWVAERPKTAF